MTRKVNVNSKYRHFKGHIYKVIAIAFDSETNNDEEPKKVVVYQDTTDESKIWVRDYAMFLSKVDTDKYPDVTQKYRFEEIH